MKTIYRTLIMAVIALCTTTMFVQCADDDDNGNAINEPTCDDGIMNADEEGIDCGGTFCEPCAVVLDFSGTYTQEDHMGRPGINTVFGGSDQVKNSFNVSITSDRATFQPIFESTLENYFDEYAVELGLDPANVNYETNILGLDATVFTTVLAQFDALQVAPDGETTYFNPGTGAALTGRNLADDVIDISLILMFGGDDLMNLNFDGDPAGEPLLITDGVDAGDRDFSLDFPYMSTVNQ
ncbi:DUF4331 domain-containing protein [Marinirhabdus gelatinilytica]|uniref:Uncharacterized protein DUF4331 n=1 Tax=Marinirhabdus gelatinilytica TaxID=1703343 RepID=A0A370QFS4_9FLAO|nr:DUF4331 domain-containing protein [Marinirhabdus gelatinilytica]RDK87149.1 uncharacterized protein DUF4331 [Marinirhabdus gelatinilytica]